MKKTTGNKNYAEIFINSTITKKDLTKAEECRSITLLEGTLEEPQFTVCKLISNASKSPDFTNLELKQCDIFSQEWSKKIPKCPNLRELVISNPQFPTRTERLWPLIEKFPDIALLILEDIEERFMKKVVKTIIQTNTQILCLHLSNCYITDDDAITLSSTLKSLNILDLSYNSVSDKGARSIILNLQNLKKLILNHNDIGDNGVYCIMRYAPVSLTCLNMFNNRNMTADMLGILLDRMRFLTNSKPATQRAHIYFVNQTRAGSIDKNMHHMTKWNRLSFLKCNPSSQPQQVKELKDRVYRSDWPVIPGLYRVGHRPMRRR